MRLKIWSSVIFPKFWKFNNPCEYIKPKLGQKGAKYLYYISRNLDEEYTGNCLSFESLSKMTLQRKYKLWHNFGSRFDFDLRGFFQAIFLEGVLEDINTWNFISKWISSRAKIIPVYGEMALTIMSRMSFRVNPLYIFAWISRNSLLETGVKSEIWVTATRLEPTTT